MALRSVCGGISALRRFSNPNIRSFHTNVVPGPTPNLVDWFTERFSAQPDKINTMMNVIYTKAHRNSVTPFNLFCRSSMDRWAIKGLRIGTQQTPTRSVVLVSGMHANEPIPIGVNLYVAAALSRNPIEGVEVTVFPVLKPKDLEQQCRNEQTIQAMTLGGISLPSSENAIKLSAEEYCGVEGPLKSYVKKRSTHFLDYVVDLNASRSTMYLKHDSLRGPLSQASKVLEGLHQPNLPSFLATGGERSLLEKLVGPPAVIVELRDRNKTLGEDHIISCAENVLSAIYKLVADTEVPPRAL